MSSRLIFRQSVALLFALLLVGCAGPSQFITHSFPETASGGFELPNPQKHIVLIFNHGSFSERQRDICWPTTWAVPAVIRQLSGKTIDGLDVVVYNFCSTELGNYDDVTRRGEPKVLKRVQRIEATVRAFEAAGVPSRQIFLIGHSAGAWASLLVARDHRVKINSVIAFGPAFAGKKHGRSLGWQDLRQRLVDELAEADHINSLVYAYEDDPYEPVSDLSFLDKIPGIHLIRVEGDWGACSGPYKHRTAFRDCFERSQAKVIRDYIAGRVSKP